MQNRNEVIFSDFNFGDNVSEDGILDMTGVALRVESDTNKVL